MSENKRFATIGITIVVVMYLLMSIVASNVGDGNNHDDAPSRTFMYE